MKCVVKYDEARTAVKAMSKFCGKKTKSATLDSVCCIIAEDDKVFIECANYAAVGFKLRIPCVVVEEEGGVCIRTRELLSFLSGVGEYLALEVKDGAMSLTSEQAQGTIVGVSEFYEQVHTLCIHPAGVAEEVHVSIEACKLIAAMAYAARCVDPNCDREEFRGVNTQFKGESIQFAGTDGHRLHLAELVMHDISEDLEVIVPMECAGMLSQVKGNVSVTVLKNRVGRHCVVFRTKDTQIVARTYGGRYPDFSKIKPAFTNWELRLAGKDFITTARSFKDHLNEAKLVNFGARDGKVKLLNYHAESFLTLNLSADTSRDSAEQNGYGFNLDYLRDALDVPGVSLVKTYADAQGADLPTFVTNESKDISFTAMIMPHE